MTKVSRSWPDIHAMIRAIPGRTCGDQQPEFLYRLSSRAGKRGEIVEIGTFRGKSTIAIAFGQQETGGRPIVTIDPVEHPDLDDNLKLAGVDSFVVRITERSSTVAKRWTKPIELLWIDGDHSYIGVAIDLRSWCRFVMPGGLVALHDYPGNPAGSKEIARAVRRYLLSRPYDWRLIADRDAGSIIAFQRIVSSPLNSSSTVIRRIRRNAGALAREILSRA